MSKKIIEVIESNETYKTMFQNNTYFHNSVKVLEDNFSEVSVLGLIETLTSIIVRLQNEIQKLSED